MKLINKLMMIGIIVAMVGGCAKKPVVQETPLETLLPFETEIQKKGKFVIGTSPDYPPFESLLNGKLIGFDIDLMQAIAKNIKTESGESYQIEWVQMSFDTIITSVQSGQLDLGISSFTYDKDRNVLFSTVYLESQQVVVVRADSSIASLADLENKKIGVQLGTTGESAAKEITGASLMSLEDVNVIFESLKNNAVDAVVVDKAVAENYVRNAGFVRIEEPLVDEYVSIIAKVGNDELIAAVNKAIEAFKLTPEYRLLLEKWQMNVE